MARLLLSFVLVLSALSSQTLLVAAQDRGTSVGFPPPELESRPPNGIAAVIVGGVLLGGAAESFALMGFCNKDDVFFSSTRSCLIAEGTLGAISFTAGITALTIGVIRRKKYKAWRGARAVHALESLRLTPIAAGGALSFSARF